jgi:hypothetical protein
MGFNATASVAARLAAAALVIGGCAMSAGVAYADPDSTSPPAPATDEPAAPSPAASPGSGPKAAIDHDGTFAVGSDIAPGTYSSAGPVANGTCYWKRVGTDGNLVDNSMSKKPQVVRIEPTDKSFKTDGCQPWQLTPDANPPASAPPPGVQGTLGILNGLLGGQNGQQAPHS